MRSSALRPLWAHSTWNPLLSKRRERRSRFASSSSTTRTVAVSVMLFPQGHQTAHFRQQRGEFNGLGLEFIAAGGEGVLTIASHGMRGKSNHRDRLSTRIRFENARGLPPVEHG